MPRSEQPTRRDAEPPPVSQPVSHLAPTPPYSRHRTCDPPRPLEISSLRQLPTGLLAMRHNAVSNRKQRAAARDVLLAATLTLGLRACVRALRQGGRSRHSPRLTHLTGNAFRLDVDSVAMPSPLPSTSRSLPARPSPLLELATSNRTRSGDVRTLVELRATGRAPERSPLSTDRRAGAVRRSPRSSLRPFRDSP